MSLSAAESFCLTFIVFCLFIDSKCAAVNTSNISNQFSEEIAVVSHSQLQEKDSCPLWFYFDSESGSCHCFNYYAAYCFYSEAYLLSGFCATYDDEKEVISLSWCPYHGFTFTKKDVSWYLKLPDNISALNDYMCGPLNREGRLCSECKEGYGHTITSVGFQHLECQKCKSVWFGILLYLFIEFFPITLFYFIILIFQVNITSAPMTCYIMYSQMFVISNDRVFAGSEGHVRDLLLSVSHNSEIVFTILMTCYDVWNLRFFRYLEPPFCISERLKPVHLAFLGYISVFYPLFLIILTWFCVWLHSHDFRPLVILWWPFRRCFARVRSKWDLASDFVNVFSSFFLLSFTKVLYETVLLLVSKKMKIFHTNHNDFTSWEYTLVVGVDQSVLYGSSEHLVFLIPSLFLCFMFLLPTLLLIFYPYRLFRAILSKCRLDGITLNFFVEKFYSSYKNGLDGGADMRSFAGLYFVVRLMLFLSDSVAIGLSIANNNPFFWRGCVSIITIILIAVSRPYKKVYMTIIDILILSVVAVLCYLMSSVYDFSEQRNVACTYYVLLALPLSCFILALVVKAIEKVTKINVCHLFYRKCYNRLKCQLNHFRLRSRSPEATQPLLEPIVLEASDAVTY